MVYSLNNDTWKQTVTYLLKFYSGFNKGSCNTQSWWDSYSAVNVLAIAGPLCLIKKAICLPAHARLNNGTCE